MIMTTQWTKLGLAVLLIVVTTAALPTLSTEAHATTTCGAPATTPQRNSSMQKHCLATPTDTIQTIADHVLPENDQSMNDRRLTTARAGGTLTPTAPAPPPAVTSTPQPETPTPSSATSTGPAASDQPTTPHANGVNPHGKIGPDRLLGPALAIGLITLAAFLVFVGPRLRRRTRPSRAHADTTQVDPDPPAPTQPG